MQESSSSRGRGGVIDGKMAGLYDLEATLGRGHFAVVKLARHVFTGEKVAVKVIDKLKLDDISKAHLFQEVRCMKLVQHPNVVRLYEVIDTQTKLYLVLELADGGDLYDYIMRHESGLSEPLAKHYFSQILRAISYCHRLHVVHRDLKPENVVFFQTTQVVKLTDFGFSNKFCPGQKLETSCGSLAYSAPEILLGDSYDAPAVDVWSLGVILYMLVCGQAPFQEANDSETLTMIMDCKYTVPSHISSHCRDLIGRMLVREPEKRAPLADIAQHPWLAGECLTSDLPLVSSQTLSDADRNNIIQKMVNGNICTKEEILESLEKNDYNYLTATYYLLAERMLRSLEPKTQPRLGASRNAPTVQVDSCKESDCSSPSSKINQNYLSMARGQADLVQRSRKCSIVAEDEEEESSSSREGSSSLNRRGSRSEGRLHLAVQEIRRQQAVQINSITEASTAPGPLHPSTGNIGVGGSTASPHHVTPVRAIKSLPSPIGSTASSPQLAAPISSINRYERRNKLRKGSTASCSSSDASDEDSETRNKRKGSNKSLERGGSSGGQDPGASSGGGSANTGGQQQGNSAPPPPSTNTDSNSNPSLDQSSSSGRRQCLSGRRRRGCETRLRESQSLNRITEVQESEGGVPSSMVLMQASTAAVPQHNHHSSESIHSSAAAGDNNNINQTGNVKRSTLLGRYLSLQKKFCLPLIGRGRLYKVPKDINQNLGPPSNQVKQQSSKN